MVASLARLGHSGSHPHYRPGQEVLCPSTITIKKEGSFFSSSSKVLCSSSITIKREPSSPKIRKSPKIKVSHQFRGSFSQTFQGVSIFSLCLELMSYYTCIKTKLPEQWYHIFTKGDISMLNCRAWWFFQNITALWEKGAVTIKIILCYIVLASEGPRPCRLTHLGVNGLFSALYSKVTTKKLTTTF